jgi:hypothetical protein
VNVRFGSVGENVVVLFDPNAVYTQAFRKAADKKSSEFSTQPIFEMDAEFRFKDDSKSGDSKKPAAGPLDKKKAIPLPEWYVNLKGIYPGMPPLLYAYAFKQSDRKSTCIPPLFCALQRLSSPLS